MKFGANLQAHLTPEWRSQYIDYEVITSINFLICNCLSCR